VAVGDGERVEEHQWEARKLAAGDVGHEEGRRGELRGDLGAAALMAGSGRLWTPRGARFGAWSRKGSRGGGRGLVCEAKGREESRAEGASELRSGARHGSACSSPWRVDGRPRRARREMAPRGEAERLRENQRRGKRRGRGAWPCRRRDGNAVNVKQRREMVVGQFRN